MKDREDLGDKDTKAALEEPIGMKNLISRMKQRVKLWYTVQKEQLAEEYDEE